MMMRAIKAFDYNGRRLRPGEVFKLQATRSEAIEAHRDVFLKAQMAEDIDPVPDKPKRGKYWRRDMRAEDE